MANVTSWFVYTKIIRTHFKDRTYVIEPDVVFTSNLRNDWKDWKTQYLQRFSFTIDEFLYYCDIWPYVGTITKEEAIRILKEYLKSYGQYLDNGERELISDSLPAGFETGERGVY